MRTLVYVEHRDGRATEGSLAAVTKAAELGGEVAACLCGTGAAELAPSVGPFGSPRVYVADHSALTAPLPQPRVEVLAQLVEREGFDTVLFACSALATDVAAGLADRLDAGLNWDLAGLEVRDGALLGLRPALQDTVLVEVGWKGTPRLALLRPGACRPQAGDVEAVVERVAAGVEEWALAATIVERTSEPAEGPSLEDADVVVTGGRGLGARAGFALLEELAEALGGVVGATLPAVEIGWYPYSRLVGQSGKTVAPKLYVACGVSGALQHRLGMQGSGAIVAINRDAGAPIFDFCDLAVVGDLHEIVPRLTELVRERRRRPGL